MFHSAGTIKVIPQRVPSGRECLLGVDLFYKLQGLELPTAAGNVGALDECGLMHWCLGPVLCICLFCGGDALHHVS